MREAMDGYEQLCARGSIAARHVVAKKINIIPFEKVTWESQSDGDVSARNIA